MVFGPESLFELPMLVKAFGSAVLFVSGKSSFMESPAATKLQQDMEDHSLSLSYASIPSEPSPSMIDNIVKQHIAYPPDVVVAVGGGSVLDAGKAISAMLKASGSVKDYLEGVGRKKPNGKKVPFIAVPTTAGTGSEVSKNAVISCIGTTGYKRSLRHDNYIPDIAVLDPMLSLGLPPVQTAASGMDAFTQLLESYLSTQSNPYTDSLALQGLRMIRENLPRVIGEGDNLKARAGMMHAAMLSGITLANVGLGLVHGFASSVGGRFPIPHGELCGSLMGPANRITLKKLRNEEDESPVIQKYAEVGKIFIDEVSIMHSDRYYAQYLVEMINQWAEAFSLPMLSDYGVKSEHVADIVATTSQKNHPINLNQEELAAILEARIE